MIVEQVGGSVEELQKKMNLKARELGCVYDILFTSNGKDVPRIKNGIHSTTAKDLASNSSILHHGASESGNFSLQLRRCLAHTFWNHSKT